MPQKDGSTKGGDGEGDSIRVFVRVRPPGRSQDTVDLGTCLSVDTTNQAIMLKAKPETKVFTFDQVADVATTQETVFSSVAKKLIDSCVAGYNGTIFAYGQTGSGKTFTMVGPSEDGTSFQHELRGVIPRSFEYLFSLVNRQKELLGERIQFLCRASFLEIYNEQLSDLLDTGGASPLLRENMKRGVFVEGLTDQAVSSASDAYQVLQNGWKNRSVAETAMNTESSRSHAVFTLHIESKENKQGAWQLRASKLNLVDLAGSERQKDTKTTGSRLREGCSINKSLSALGNVIMCLVHNSHDEKSRYVPYRDSKLTFLLRDSLGGNAKTHIIACIHPGNKFFGETLSTLQFARRAKQIKNKAVVNEDLHGNIPALQAEIRRLKEDLAARDKVIGDFTPSGITAPSGAGITSGPWRERFMEAIRLFEAQKLKLKLKDQKQALLETHLEHKEKKVLQTKMVLLFRTETIKKWEAQHKKKNPAQGADDLVMALRDEVRALEEVSGGKEEVALLTAERSALEREVDVLRTQLSLQQSAEDALMAAYEQAMAETDPRPQMCTPQNTAVEEPVGTVERQKSQIAKIQAEMDTLKRSHTVELESTKKSMEDMERKLASAQTANGELEKTLKMTQERQNIERQNQEKLHLDTIKTITTPKKAQYQLRSRAVMLSSSGSELFPQSPLLRTPEGVSLAEVEDGFQEEQMPGDMYQEQIEGLTNEIQTLQQENKNLMKKLQEYDTKFIDITTEQSGVQTRNKSLEEKLASYEEAGKSHNDELSSLQKQLDKSLQSQYYAEDELRDLRVMATQTEKHMTEIRVEKDQLRQDNTMYESKIPSLTYQLEESQRSVADLTLSLNSAQEDLENRQIELEYLASQQKELESRLQTETNQHGQTREYLQMVQVQLDKQTATVEQLKSQMQQQGSEKEQELLTVLEQKTAAEDELATRAAQYTALEQKAEQLSQQLSAAQDQLSQQQRMKKDLEDAMMRVSADRNQLRQEMKACQLESDDLQSQLSDLTERHEAEAALHEAELLTLKEEKSMAVHELEQQLGERDNKLCVLQAQSDVVQEDVEELQYINEELIQRNRELEADAQRNETEISQLNDLKVELSTRITELDTKLAETEEKLSSQQQQHMVLLQDREALLTAEDVVAQLREELNELRCSHIEKSQDLKSARLDVSSLSRQLEELSQQNTQLRATQAKERTTAELELNKKDEELEKWKQIAAKGQSVTEQLNKKKCELELLLSQRDLDLVETRNTIQKNKEALESARNLDLRVEDQNRIIINLEQDVTDKTEQIERLTAVTVSDQEEMSKLTSEMAQLQEVNRHVTTDRDDLRSRLDKVELEAAKLAGHSNLNQKIHYVQQLKDQNRQLSESNAKQELRIVQLETKLKDSNTRHPSGKMFTPVKAPSCGTPSRQHGQGEMPAAGTPTHKTATGTASHKTTVSTPSSKTATGTASHKTTVSTPSSKTATGTASHKTTASTPSHKTAAALKENQPPAHL